MTTDEGEIGSAPLKRDLLGRPLPWAEEDLKPSDGEALVTALNAADPRAIAAAILGAELQLGGFERSRQTLLRWLLDRDGPSCLLPARALADTLRIIGKPNGDRDLLPLVSVAALVADLLSQSPPTNAPVATQMTLDAAIAAGNPAAATVAVQQRLDSGDGGAAMEKELIGLLYQYAGRAGHVAPFLAAACELRQTCGDEIVGPLHAALAGSLAGAVAVAVDPALAAHLVRVEPLLRQASDLHAAENPVRAAAFNEPRFRQHLLAGQSDTAIKALHRGLSFGVPRELLARSLCLAAAERMLRFDSQIDGRNDRLERWADVGWLLVQSSAIAQLRRQHDVPGWIGLLAHGVFLVEAAATLDAPPQKRPPLPEAEEGTAAWEHGPQIGRICGLIRASRGDDAVAALRGYLQLDLPEQPLSSQLARLMFGDARRPAWQQTTLIATVCAAVEEFNVLAEHPHRELLLCAAIRLMTAPERAAEASGLGASWLDLRHSGRQASATAALPWLNR